MLQMFYTLNGRKPSLADAASIWVAPNAAIIGDVRIGRNVSVWFAATVRGDDETITLGEDCNVQDCAVLHADPGVALELGSRVSVGHMAMLHGCSIGEGSLIGIGAIILNHARVGTNCLIGARTLITEGKSIPDNSVVFGAPAKIIRQVSADDRAQMSSVVESYLRRRQRYSVEMHDMRLAP